MRPRNASAFGSGATAAARWGSRSHRLPPHMQAVEGDPHAVFGLHLVPVVGLHQLTGAPWLNGEVEMTADVPAPPVQRLGITAQAVFRREDVGVVIAASGCSQRAKQALLRRSG